MELRCEECGEVIDSGVIEDGKIYHKACLTMLEDNRREDTAYQLGQRFPHLTSGVIEILADAKSEEMLEEIMKSRWAILYYDDSHDLCSDSFDTKVKMQEFLSDLVHGNWFEGEYNFQWEYVLNNGKLYIDMQEDAANVHIKVTMYGPN
jgi:hypothetical protein